MMMTMTTNNSNSDSERNIDDDDDDHDDHNSTRGMNNIDDSNHTEDGDDEIIQQTGGSIGYGGFICGYVIDITKDLYHSSGLVINNKLNWLLIMGPIALLGDATGLLGETACFAFSGIALIPCAERLSFVTEQVAEHTNGTIGALLNATFGNAPELLIASAALRKGYYRVVQLAMLGSMLTNLLFVFGVSCLIGGLRWQVQELRITSGNVSVGMLLLSVAGSLLPATLILGGQLKQSSSSSSSDSSDGGDNDDTSIITQGFSSSSSDTPSLEELQFCRVNAFVMIFMYGCYLIFQLGTHKEEFDEDENVVQTANHNQLHLSPHFTSRHGRHKARRNAFCVWAVRRTRCFLRMSGSSNDNNRGEQGWVASPSITAERRGGGSGSGGENNNGGDVEMMYSDRLLRMIPRDDKNNNNSIRYSDDDEDESSSDEECLLPQNATLNQDRDNGYFDDYDTASSAAEPRLRSRGGSNAGDGGARKQHSLSPRRDKTQQLNNNNNKTSSSSKGKKKKKKNRTPGVLLPLGLAEPSETIQRALPSLPNLDLNDSNHHHHHPRSSSEPQMSFRVGILWLFIITCGVSAMSDILVDTIDGFAIRLRISEVFTSMVIVPFFSNVAEQVSAILFAYRNEMDLAVGVTVGSAIQVASFVLPGCVIMGWLFDRSMTLYFHAYETVSLFLAVIVVAAVLQGGTTNWLVGATCISVYVMIATGFWFHTLEDLSVDAEATLTGLNNATRALLSTS